MPGQPLSASRSISAKLLRRRVAFDLDGDRHLLESRGRRIRHHVAADVEIGARHRLEALVVDAHLGRVEREHRGVAADRARQQKFERRRRVGEPADVLRLADDEMPAAVAAFPRAR